MRLGRHSNGVFIGNGKTQAETRHAISPLVGSVRSLITRTYQISNHLVFLGEIKHQDSAGNSGVLKEGWVQWMTAGSGVVHSEMPSDEFLKRGGRSEGFQLWVNLPAKDKMIKPRYQDTDAKKIPVVTSPGEISASEIFVMQNILNCAGVCR